MHCTLIPKLILAGIHIQMLAAASVTPLMPLPVENHEADLLAAARTVEPIELEDGIQQYDLVIARVATWDGVTHLNLRILLPPGDPESLRPTVAYIHGGSFIGGSYELNVHSTRNQISHAHKALLDGGFAVVSLGYRLARQAGWPAPVADTLCGLRFLRQHGHHWEIDPNRIGVSGHSAGARIAGLLGMVPRDAFHTGNLPWEGPDAAPAAIWMWAGSVWDTPRVDRWDEFGKPEKYSVPRLLMGDHPARDDATRHRLRLRFNPPHLHTNMPPLVLFRGESDYQGDHSDAEKTVEVWKALGVGATLRIEPGGHNAAGDPAALVTFFKQHLVAPGPERPRGDPLTAARVLLDQNEPAWALEILNATHTTDGGRRPPPGQWMILSSHHLLWLPDTSGWPEVHRELAAQAMTALAATEQSASRRFANRGNTFQALNAIQNLSLLDSDTRAPSGIGDIRIRAETEQALFLGLETANQQLHAGEHTTALKTLEALNDPRASDAAERIRPRPVPEKPAWADAHGIDVYGPWADLRLDEGTTLRFRRVEAGSWELPAHLHYRNTTTEPWVNTIDIPHPFWLAETPVTRAQWNAGLDLPFPEEKATHPKTRIDFLQIEDWLETLSAAHDLVARLPTESEWLHASTAGGRSKASATLDLHAVHALDVDPGDPGPKPVHGVTPILGGFYGMVGGVHEWTGSPGHHTARFTDETGRFRVMAYPIARGGAWSSMPHALGPHQRGAMRHGNRQPDLGFRPAIGGGPDAINWKRRLY